MIPDMFRPTSPRGGACWTGALVASLAACGARTPLDDVESSPEDPPPSCEVNDRVVGDGQWLRRLGAFEDQAQIAVADTGDLTLVASVSGTVQLDCVELPALGETDLLLAAFTAAGDVRWAKRLGGPDVDINSVQSGVDADGNLYMVASITRGSLDFGGGPVSAGLVIVSFDDNGSYRWAQSYPHTGSMRVATGTVGSFGSTSAAIVFQDMFSIDGETYDGGFDLASAQLVLRWDPDGNLVLKRYLSPSSAVTVATMASGPDGAWAISARTPDGVFVDVLDGELLRWSFEIGSFPAALLLTPSQVIAGGDNANNLTEPFVEALAIDTGEPRWLSFLDSWRGEDESQWPPYATSIVEVDGSLIVAAPLLGTVDFGSGPFTSAGSFDAMLVRFDAAGQFQTARVVGGPAAESIVDMEATPTGQLAVTLHAPDGLDLGFGAPTLACDGQCDQLYIGVIDPPR